MRYLSILILFLGMQSTCFAHKYYFGFAEVEYNDISKKFETTIIVTTHDLEIALENDGVNVGKLNELGTDASKLITLEKYINKRFSIHSGTNNCEMKIVGHQTMLNGSVHFFLESTPIEINESIEVHFDLLMDEFQEQQNKITFYYQDKTFTVPFITNERNQIINLEKN